MPFGRSIGSVTDAKVTTWGHKPGVFWRATSKSIETKPYLRRAPRCTRDVVCYVLVWYIPTNRPLVKNRAWKRGG